MLKRARKICCVPLFLRSIFGGYLMICVDVVPGVCGCCVMNCQRLEHLTVHLSTMCLWRRSCLFYEITVPSTTGLYLTCHVFHDVIFGCSSSVYYDIMDKASQVSPTYVHWMFMSFVPWIWLGNMAYYGCIVLCYSGDFLAMPIFG